MMTMTISLLMGMPAGDFVAGVVFIPLPPDDNERPLDEDWTKLNEDHLADGYSSI